MDFIRSNVLRRGGPSDREEGDVEQQSRAAEMQERQGESSQRIQVPRGRSNSVRPWQRRNITGNAETDSPKTPRFNIGLPTLPSTRLHLPNLVRTWTRGESGPPTPPIPPPGPISQPLLQRTETAQVPLIVAPEPTHQEESRSRSARQPGGTDPTGVNMADLAETGRAGGNLPAGDSADPRRRRRRERNRGRGRDSESDRDRENGHPKRFLFCFPWVKSRRIRSQILRCFVSGMFLLLLLSVYLALNATKNISSSEFTVLLILIILFTTIFFCHGLIRLCMLIVKPPNEEERSRRAHLPQMFGPGGYAIPTRPIRVVLARDEEAAGIESDTTKLQPPAYGLWRESVRVDPNRIYWQRNDQATPDDPRPTTGNRPPSYASEDGIEYVVEARPRSIAPLSDVPLPPHPSEVGRLAQRPSSS